MEKSRKEFLSDMNSILDEFFSESGYPAELVDHTRKMIHHVMPDHIEASMPLLFPKFCNILKTNITHQETQQALLLGWINQMLASYYIFRDDYVDNTDLRWGHSSWPKLHNQSKVVVLPDLSVMRSVTFFTLRKKFSHMPSIYLQVLHLILDCDNMMSKGLRLEKHQLVQNLRDGKVTLESFNMDTYKLIFGLQFSVFTYLPLALAMTISGYEMDEQKELYQKVETFCESFGVFMKVCDDYHEIYNISNKIVTDNSDTDIREGHFTWLFLMAKESCNSSDQIKYLLEHYGREDDKSVVNIKDLLGEIGIQDLFENYRKQTYDNIVQEINSSFSENVKVQEMIKWYVDRFMKHYEE